MQILYGIVVFYFEFPKDQDNADINAAKNILAAGHAVLACGASA
jgi:hypothetical protein